jgi:hypothetical protein
MLNNAEAGSLPVVRAAALVEHYQKTMDLVTHHWERRSRQFVTLVAVLAGAALVAFMRPLIAPALASLIQERFPKLDQQAVEQVTPVAADLLLAFLVISVFYLTASLLNRTNLITNYYGYLEEMETEIRVVLAFTPASIAFTREGEFYQVAGSDISRLIARCYKWVLGLLLVFFFAARLFFDFPQGLPPWQQPDRALVLTYVAKSFLIVIDVIVVVATTWLFVRFVRLRPLTRAEREQRLQSLAARS